LKNKETPLLTITQSLHTQIIGDGGFFIDQNLYLKLQNEHLSIIFVLKLKDPF